MYNVFIGGRIGALVVREPTRWEGSTGRNYAGYICVCDCGAAVRVRSEDLRHGKQLYCTKTCEMRYPRTLEEWLAHTKKVGTCREWQGPTTNGYGRIQRKGETVYAHREVVRLTTGVSPEVVMHSCDNPLCINPAHLVPGTHEANFADMVSKQRHAKGVEHYKARLTPAQVLRARRKREEGATLTALAKEFGVARSTIGAAIAGQSWRSLK